MNGLVVVLNEPCTFFIINIKLKWVRWEHCGKTLNSWDNYMHAHKWHLMLLKICQANTEDI